MSLSALSSLWNDQSPGPPPKLGSLEPEKTEGVVPRRVKDEGHKGGRSQPCPGGDRGGLGLRLHLSPPGARREARHKDR